MSEDLKSLTFSHRFASGSSITLTVERKANTKPKATSSIQCSQLTRDELSEYLPFRNNVVARMMSILTPEEVFAANKS